MKRSLQHSLLTTLFAALPLTAHAEPNGKPFTDLRTDIAILESELENSTETGEEKDNQQDGTISELMGIVDELMLRIETLENSPPPQIDGHAVNLYADDSQFLALSTNAQTGFNFASAFTWEGWIKARDLTGRYQSIFTRWAPAGNGSFRIALGAAARLEIEFRDQGQHESQFFTFTTLPIELDKWAHVAVVVNINTPSASVYVNGATVSVNTIDANATSLNPSTADIYLGFAQNGTSAQTFDGLFDEVRVWNRALSQTDIANNRTVVMNGNEPGLIAYWRFEGDTLDLTPNQNDLTPINGTGITNDAPF